MSMDVKDERIVNEDYLWDRSGPEDPEIARLERSLGMLRAPEPPAPLRLPSASSSRRRLLRRRDRAMPGLGRLRAAVRDRGDADDGGGELWLSVNPYGPRPSWQMSRLDGMPRVASQAMAQPTGQLPVGEWVETDGQARARIRVAHIGHVDVEPDSQVGLMSTRPGNYRLRLERGALQALILAPPGQFHVETPAAVATDLGCAYRLRVDERGESELRVTSGWVSLDRPADQVSARRGCRRRSGRHHHRCAIVIRAIGRDVSREACRRASDWSGHAVHGGCLGGFRLGAAADRLRR